MGIQHPRYLLAYKEFFNNPTIVGIDISEKFKIEYDEMNKISGIDISIFDCTDKVLLDEKLKSMKFDIIIDDASHEIGSQKLSFQHPKEYLKPNGIYVIEDMQCAVSLERDTFFSDWLVIDNRHIKNRYDDVLCIYRNG